MRRIMYLVCLTGLLCACNQHNETKKTHDFIRHTQQKYANQTEPQLAVPTVPKAHYNTSHLGDPFKRPVTNRNKKRYPNAVLRTYNINSLKLIGIIGEHKQRWALIVTPDGTLRKIKQGARIGTSQALVTDISLSSVKLLLDGNNNRDPITKVLQLNKEKS